MDPTLKRRLIGAAILVAIAAIVLPMFLTGPRPAPERTETLPVVIPQGEERQTQRLNLPIGRDAADPVPDGVAEADRVAAVDTSEAGTLPMPTLSEDATPPVPAAAAPAPDTAAPATATPGSDASTPPAGTAAPPVAASPSQAPATSASGRFWVNLGSYGQGANADRVVAAARGRNVSVQRETVDTGGRQLIRLRAGPYASRAQAEQARQLLIAAVPDARPSIDEADGVPTSDTPAPAAAATAAAAGTGAWAVQVGAFDQEANARQLSDRLKGAGLPAYVERRGSSFAVRVGPYVRRADAEAQRQQLKSAQKLDGLVVSHRG